MSQKSPTTQRKAERDTTKGQDAFLGMLSGIPASEIPDGYSAVNENLIDHGKWSEGRPGSRQYSAIPVPGRIYARVEHEASGLLVLQVGDEVYVANRALTTYTLVINRTGVALSETAGSMVASGDDVVFANAHGRFRIVLDDPHSYYYMLRINGPNPNAIPVDAPETVIHQYGYRYIYSLGLLEGPIGSLRTEDDIEIIHETGTCFQINSDKDYAEIFHITPIGENLAIGHLVEELRVPNGVYDMTHFTLYRTENIGEHSGGVNPTARGMGNRLDQMTYANDIPVAKAFSAVLVGVNVTTVTGTFTIGDVGNRLTDINGNSDIIASYIAANQVTITGVGTLPAGAIAVAIGEGRVFVGTQAGTLITRLVGAAFIATDVGKTVFWADSNYSVIVSVNVGAGTAVAAWPENHGAQTFTMYPLAANFVRNYNDTTLDTGGGAAIISIEDRIISGLDVYIPRRYWQPVPSGEIVMNSTGFMFFAARNGVDYYYSQVGDKPYTAGLYRPVEQQGKVDDPIRDIRGLPGLAIILQTSKTKTVPLATSTNVGRTEVGENVSHLLEPYDADDHIGVYFWQSIQYVGSNKFIALTSEPAVRYFQDGKWNEVNEAVDRRTGYDAVMKNYLSLIDPAYGCASAYSEEDGYELWFYRWVAVDSDGVIFDTGGTGLTGDDIYNDTGGVAVPAGDVIHDTGGIFDGS